MPLVVQLDIIGTKSWNAYKYTIKDNLHTNRNLISVCNTIAHTLIEQLIQNIRILGYYVGLSQVSHFWTFPIINLTPVVLSVYKQMDKWTKWHNNGFDFAKACRCQFCVWTNVLQENYRTHVSHVHQDVNDRLRLKHWYCERLVVVDLIH